MIVVGLKPLSKYQKNTVSFHTFSINIILIPISRILDMQKFITLLKLLHINYY